MTKALWIAVVVLIAVVVADALEPVPVDPSIRARADSIADLAQDVGFWRNEVRNVVAERNFVERQRDSISVWATEAIRRATVAREITQVRAAEAGAALSQTLDSIRVSAPHVAPLVDVLASQIADQADALRQETLVVDRIVSVLRTEQAQDRELIRVQGRTIASQAEVIIAQDAQVRLLEANVAAWEAQATPSLLTRLWRAKSGLAVGFAAGVLLTVAVQ